SRGTACDVAAFGVELSSIRKQLELGRQFEAAVGATRKVDHRRDRFERDRTITMREGFAVGGFVAQLGSNARGVDAKQDQPGSSAEETRGRSSDLRARRAMNESLAFEAVGCVRAGLERGGKCAALGDVKHVTVSVAHWAPLVIRRPKPLAWSAVVRGAVPEFAGRFAAPRSPNGKSPWNPPPPPLCASSRLGGGSPLGCARRASRGFRAAPE